MCIGVYMPYAVLIFSDYFHTMNKKFTAIIMAAILLSACSSKVQQNAEEITYQGNTVTVQGESPIIGKLNIQTLALTPFSSEFRTVGTVQAETGHLAEVNVPFDGRILRSNVTLGAKVSAGQTLFEMSSPDFLAASKDYFQFVQNYEKAKADYDRKKVLMEHGIVSKKELEEAFTEAENARHDKESAAATLKVFGTDPASMKLGQAMRIVAPISGEVVRNDVTVGAFTKADSEPLVTIADLNKVWVNALIKERYIGSVVKGGTAEIVPEGADMEPIIGQVLNVGNMVDEETRSVQVIISCDNKDLRLKHGMYVSVHFLAEPKDAIVVPSTAVFQGEEHSFVYVCTDQKNVFQKQQVELGGSNDDNSMICIKSGLKAGDRIISVGGLYLNN